MSTASDARTRQAGGSGSGLRLTSWDVGYLASTLVVLAGSLVPLITVRWGVNLWGVYNLFFLGVGVLLPLVAAGFLVARAASGASTAQRRESGPHLGSLSAEQFAQVAAWLALAFYFVTFATTLDPVLLIGLAGGLGLVVTSPLRGLVAPLVSGTAAAGAAGGAGAAGAAAPRAASPAEERAEPPVHGPDHLHGPFTTPAPAPGAGEAQEPFGAGSGSASDAYSGSDSDVGSGAGVGTEAQAGVGTEAEGFPSPSYGSHGQSTAPQSPEGYRTTPGAGGLDGTQTGGQAGGQVGGRDDRPEEGQDAAGPARPAAAGVSAENAASLSAATPAAPRGTEPAEYEAFWFAVGTRRSAVDAEHVPLFELEPGGWILALEDRGQEYLVQNTDGRTGLLRDLTDIERA